MKKEIKYRDYRIGKEVFTVKLVYLPDGGFFYNPTIKIYVMKWHSEPKTFFEKLTENRKFLINSYELDSFLWTRHLTLEKYCTFLCEFNTKEENLKSKNRWDQMISKVLNEWDQM